MKYHPTKIINLILYFLILTLIVACSKDIDILTDAVLNDTATNVEERANSEEEEETEEEAESQEEETEEEAETPEEEPPAEDGMEDGFESRITEFPPIDDAHVQSGKGYNQTIIRLDENNRTSYLKFDLSAIAAIGGYITDATLEFTVNSDEGNGTINIYKGLDSEWTEQEIDNNNIPEIDILLGTITKEYKIGNTEEVLLSGSDLIPENTTLILEHNEGNDLAIASKEHPSKIGPKLIITYNAPETADAIVIIEEEPAPPGEEETPEEENTPAENEAPMAIADATPSSGGAPLQVSFTGSNSTDDNDITTYAWNFKDGGTASTANPSHTFTDVGTYEVALTVTDAEGLTSTDTVTITVNEESNEAPVARATASPLSGTAPLEVSFTGSNSSDDNSVASYSWNFKDGSSSNNANPTHTFNNAGTYAVELTVTDENGLSDKETVNITVNAPVTNEAPVAVATANPINGDAPLQVQFNSTGSTDDNGITNRLWQFTPNDASSQTNPTRTFDNAGVYEVTLTVTDAEGLTDTDTVTITVNAGGNSGGGGNYPPGAVLASSFGYNSNDATDAFIDAINSGASTVVIDKQSSDWIIRPAKFFNVRDMDIILESGVVIRAKPGAYPGVNDRLLEFVNGINIDIIGNNGTLTMNKNEYTNGEARHALSLNSCRNVTIKDLLIKDSGGDGIYLGGSSSGTYNENITVDNVTCRNHRRVGMTIISAQNVFVRNSEFTQTSGVRPETGIQLEPNHANERLVNINFTNCKITSNNSNGIHVSVQNFNSSTLPISLRVADSEFSYNSQSGSNPKPKAEVYLGAGDVSNPVGGEVRFERVTFSGSNRSILFSKKPANTYNAIFTDCVANNVGKNGFKPIVLEADGQANTLGGFVFNNFHISYNSNLPFMQVAAPSTHILKNITGTFTIDEPYNNPPLFKGSHNPNNNVNVDIDYTHID